jgi:AraC-like DNA-binding protein
LDSEHRGGSEDDAMAAPSASSTLAFSTRSLPMREQREAWRAGNAPSLDVIFEDERPSGAGFIAEREVVTFGPFVMTRVVADSATAIRRRAHAQRDGLDHWCLNLTTRGNRRFRWDRGDRCMSLPAGQLHVQALDEAYWGFRENTEWVGVFFARDSFPSLSVHLDATRDLPRADGLSRMLAGYLARLWKALPAMSAEERDRAAEATTAMVQACTTRTPDSLAMAGPILLDHQRARALSFIRRHLGSSRLTPAMVARALGISRSQIYRAFEPVGGVAGAIQEERLKAAGRLLLRGDERRSITEIAEAVGIVDLSSFSRQFRRTFGTTASVWRGEARARRDDHGKPRGFGLADFLR